MGFIQSNNNANSLLSLSGAKISDNYDFKASDGVITINESDYKRLLFVSNLTTGDVLYNPINPYLKGKIQQNNQVALNIDTSSMNDTDNLFVIYQSYYNYEETIIDTLNKVFNAIQETNNLLQKIYS